MVLKVGGWFEVELSRCALFVRVGRREWYAGRYRVKRAPNVSTVEINNINGCKQIRIGQWIAGTSKAY
jgi:hypothetical protein